MFYLKSFVKKYLGINDLSAKNDLIKGSIDSISNKVDELKILSARSLISQLKLRNIICDNLACVEFKVFSQFGDDGIIQYLVNLLNIDNRSFIEFGTQNYTESNTRFLLINNNWRGLVIDGDKSNIDYIKNDDIYWPYDITAVTSFITRDNINDIISSNGFSGEIGLLSIDIDGNDFWVWKSMNNVNPIIVIVEYNSIFGPQFAVTIPYSENFYRTEAHYSNLYWGCSLKALCILANEKNYSFVGCNSSGNNAYFIRKDSLGLLKEKTVQEGFVRSKIRESRDINGNLTYITGDDRLREIASMDVFDIEKNKIIKIQDMIDS